MGKARAILFDASDHFVADDGWAIASHIALSELTSLFPFLIFVTALAGFLGTQSLADEATRLIFAAWPAAVAGPIAGGDRRVASSARLCVPRKPASAVGRSEREKAKSLRAAQYGWRSPSLHGDEMIARVEKNGPRLAHGRATVEIAKLATRHHLGVRSATPLYHAPSGI